MTARRPRRIASDEAQSWARNLRLGNPYAKAIMNVLALYVNENGLAWPGLATLSSDTDISEDTILRRLRWLEAIGAIAMFKCWVDDSGVRNRAGRGRPTSSDIQFLFAADVEVIEAAAADGVEDRPALKGAAKASHEERISTRPLRQQTEDAEPVSTQLAPSQPPQAAAPHIEKNLEREDSPQAPLRGGSSEDSEKRFQAFKAGYPDGVIDLDAARRAFAALSRADQEACLAAVPVYAARCRARREKSMKGHLFVRKRAWDGLLAAAEHATAGPYDRHSEVGRALVALMRIGRWRLAESNGGQLIYPRPITAQLLALAQAPDGGEVYPIGSKSFGAWRRLIDECLPNHGRLSEITAPWPYPPSATGKVYSAGSDPPDDRVEGTLATRADLAEFTRGVCGP